MEGHVKHSATGEDRRCCYLLSLEDILSLQSFAISSQQQWHILLVELWHPVCLCLEEFRLSRCACQRFQLHLGSNLPEQSLITACKIQTYVCVYIYIYYVKICMHKTINNSKVNYKHIKHNT